jgi:SAM-dependent methyltransferase
LEKARALVSEQKIGNLSFQNANIYNLPLPDASFDVAFASNIMMHLDDPLSALKEIRRVLKPGGFVGLSDRAQEFVIREPSNALLEAWRELHPRAAAQNGGTPTFGPRQRAFLRQAGFSRTQGLSFARAIGMQEDALGFARVEMAQLRDLAGPTAIREGWMEQDEVDAMAEALTAWSNDPDAYAVVIICRAIGWV